MKVLIAIDSFKGSLSSLEAAAAVREGIVRVRPDAETVLMPLADGGEGTVDAFIHGLSAERVTVPVTGPLGDEVQAVYGRNGGLAVMEMAQASGLPLVRNVPEERRDARRASTCGVGEMIAHALEAGCREFLMGIGGSATTDGGLGMLQALGFRFLNAAGEEVGRGNAALADIVSIDDANVLPTLREAHFRIACDVTNPLCGPLGAAHVYGPQKGIRPEDLDTADAALASFAEVACAFSGRDHRETAGAGAAGGLGFGFLTFLDAELRSGVDLVLDCLGMDAAMEGCDVVVTGEGRLDEQTCMGKAPGGVAALARRHGARVIAFSGCIGKGARAVNDAGIDAFFPILRNIVSLEEALDPANAARNLADTAEQVFRLL